VLDDKREPTPPRVLGAALLLRAEGASLLAVSVLSLTWRQSPAGT
jgi:hypothetical protein